MTKQVIEKVFHTEGTCGLNNKHNTVLCEIAMEEDKEREES